MNTIERSGHRARRLAQTEIWARFIVEHPTEEWSRIQAELLDSQFENAHILHWTKEDVDFVKCKKFKNNL